MLLLRDIIFSLLGPKMLHAVLMYLRTQITNTAEYAGQPLEYEFREVI